MVTHFWTQLWFILHFVVNAGRRSGVVVLLRSWTIVNFNVIIMLDQDWFFHHSFQKTEIRGSS
jgi:hypothetical protein